MRHCFPKVILHNCQFDCVVLSKERMKIETALGMCVRMQTSDMKADGTLNLCV